MRLKTVAKFAGVAAGGVLTGLALYYFREIEPKIPGPPLFVAWVSIAARLSIVGVAIGAASRVI